MTPVTNAKKPPQPAFNSLFEMRRRDEGVRRRLCRGLSILYLRCMSYRKAPSATAKRELFQFSIWDAEEEYKIAKLSHYQTFQFSIWDARHKLLPPHSCAGNGRLSILYLRCLRMDCGFVRELIAMLSILYLRCLYEHIFNVASTCSSLSILYLRCRLVCGSQQDREMRSFNSLFEMRLSLYWSSAQLSCSSSFQFSIW